MCITENNLYPSVLKHLWGFVFGNLKSKNPQENHTEVCAQGPMCRVSLSKLDLGSGNLLGIKGLCLYVHLCLSLSVSVVTSCLTQSSGGFFFHFSVYILCSSLLFRPFPLLTSSHMWATIVKIDHLSALLFTVA